MHGSRKPTEKEIEAAKMYRSIRKANKIGLKLMAKMTGYDYHYLTHVESGYDPISISVMEEYERVINYINAGCQKNKRKRRNLKKVLDI